MPEDFASKEQIFFILNPSKPTPKCISVLAAESVTEHTPKRSVIEEETIVQVNPVDMFVVVETEDNENPLPKLFSIKLKLPEDSTSQKKFSDFFRDHFSVFLTGNKSKLGENIQITNHEFAEYIYEHEHNKTKQKLFDFLLFSGFNITKESMNALSFVA